jgi:uncharacterized protein
MDIHRFHQNGMYIVLDVNSGAVHVVDKIAYDALAVFDGTNDDAVRAALAGEYGADAVAEVLAELKGLVAEGRLFAPAVEVPALIDDAPLVKSLCLHVAHDCNLRCGYCFAGTGDFGHGRGLMPPEIAEQAIDFIIAAAVAAGTAR